MEMKSITDRLQLVHVEAKELELKMAEFKDGLRAQINSILSVRPPLKSRPVLLPPPSEQIPDLIDLDTNYEAVRTTQNN